MRIAPIPLFVIAAAAVTTIMAVIVVPVPLKAVRRGDTPHMTPAS